MLFKLVLVNSQTTCSWKLLNDFMNFLILMCFSWVCPNQNTLPLMPKCFLCFCVLSGSYSPLHLRWHCCHPPPGSLQQAPASSLLLSTQHPPLLPAQHSQTWNCFYFLFQILLWLFIFYRGKSNPILAPFSAISFICSASSCVLQLLQVYSSTHVHALHWTTIPSPCSIWQTPILFQISVLV